MFYPTARTGQSGQVRAASESANSVNGVYKETSRSDYAYVFQSGAVQSSLAYRADVSKASVFTTSYHYDANGHLSSAQVSDGRPRTVSFVNDAQGQVLVRSEADNNAGAGDPRQFYYYANGVQVGSNGNNGNLDPSYRTALAERTAGASGTPGPFRLGSNAAVPYADFDQSYDAINPGNAGNGTARYTVRQGDTLQSIAASLFGDASLWYIIGEANGLTSSSALSAGQSLTILSSAWILLAFAPSSRMRLMIGSSSAYACPIHPASVERSISTPCAAIISDWR